jgi:hypothetical protein
MRSRLLNAVEWLRAGYPDAAPRTGYCPLIALHGPASLTPRQVSLVTNALGAHVGEPSGTDIEAAILKITDRLPHPGQVAQIRRNQPR